jgi:hypothetical protein
VNSIREKEREKVFWKSLTMQPTKNDSQLCISTAALSLAVVIIQIESVVNFSCQRKVSGGTFPTDSTENDSRFAFQQQLKVFSRIECRRLF